MNKILKHIVKKMLELITGSKINLEAFQTIIKKKLPHPREKFRVGLIMQ